MQFSTWAMGLATRWSSSSNKWLKLLTFSVSFCHKGTSFTVKKIVFSFVHVKRGNRGWTLATTYLQLRLLRICWSYHYPPSSNMNRFNTFVVSLWAVYFNVSCAFLLLAVCPATADNLTMVVAITIASGMGNVSQISDSNSPQGSTLVCLSMGFYWINDMLQHHLNFLQCGAYPLDHCGPFRVHLFCSSTLHGCWKRMAQI